MAERPTALHIQIAQEIFGWQWREDWQAWCPPGWPARGDFGLAYLQRLEVLRAHGGLRTGAGIDQWGRPVMPAYQYNAEHTELLWQWLHTQPGIESVRFVPLPGPPDNLLGVTPWRCVIMAAPDRVAAGAGDTHREALCRAVLALVTGVRQPIRAAGIEDVRQAAPEERNNP
jgi:hypothetical protein